MLTLSAVRYVADIVRKTIRKARARVNIAGGTRTVAGSAREDLTGLPDARQTGHAAVAGCAGRTAGRTGCSIESVAASRTAAERGRARRVETREAPRRVARCAFRSARNAARARAGVVEVMVALALVREIHVGSAAG